jgi:hypothetical protein
MPVMPRPPASLRHITAHRLAFGTVALTVLFTITCAAAAAAFASAVTQIAVRRSLSAEAGSTILVSGQPSAGSAGRASALVTATIARASAGLPMAITASLQSPYLNLPASSLGGGQGAGQQGGAGQGGAGQALAQIISLPGVQRHASLVSGRWPAGGGRGPVPVCLPVQPARRLHLVSGDTLTLRDGAGGPAVVAVVSCTFRRDRAAAAYWSLSPLGSAGISDAGGSRIYGPLVTSPAVTAGGRVPVESAVWLAQPDFSALHAPNLAGLGRRIGAATGVLANSSALGGATVRTRLPALLANLATALVVARSQLLIGVLILLVIAGATVTVTVALLARRREAEAALLAARGASRRQLAARGLTDALLLAIPAGLAGPVIGGSLVPLMTRFGSLARAGLTLPGGQPASAWLAGAAVAAGCAVIISLPWLRRPPSPVQQRVRRGRQRAVGALLTAGPDVALVVLAAGAAWQLAHFSAPVLTGIDGQAGVDPILVSAPVLALAAGTLVTVRLLPLAARLGDRAAARSRGLTVAAAAWQISRRPLQRSGPALLAVLAVATAVIALAEQSSWQRSVQDQARFAVGADTRITLPAAARLPVGQVADITAARGVRASTPAIREEFSLPQGANATLLALDPRPAAGVVGFAAGTGADSLGRSLAALQPKGPAPGVAIPGRPARLRVAARLAGAGIAAPVLLIQLTDAAGVGYQVLAGGLPADGQRHELTATIAAGHRADYPLRLTGFTVQYLQTGQRPAPASLNIDSVSAGATMRGPFGPAFPAAAAGGAGGAGRELATTTGGAPFAAGRAVVRAGPAVAVAFQTGSAQGSPVAVALSVTAGPAVDALPGVAVGNFLSVSGVRLGHTVLVEVQGVAIPVVPTVTITRFATVTGSAGGLVVDQAALQDALRTRGLTPAPATEWWLKTSAGPLVDGLPPGTSVASRVALARSLSTEPLSAAPLQALLVIAAAAIALACGGFVVSMLTGRDRQRDIAMLDALGVRPGQVLRLLCLEQAMTAVPAAAAGLLLGVLLSSLVVPAVSLTAQAVHPDPPVLVLVPWPLAIGTAAIIAAMPVLAAAVSATRRMTAAAMLRVEEDP